jgi:hypothetical protein
MMQDLLELIGLAIACNILKDESIYGFDTYRA